MKYEIDTLLRAKNYDRLIEFCQAEKNAWKALRMNLFTDDDALRWPTIEVTASLMKLWWEKGEEEKVREFIRGLFWSLNDESGGIGWNAPQTIAEIIVLIPELIDPYGSMIIDRTLDEPMLMQGGLWAIGRLGRRIEPAVALFKDLVMKSFEREDPQTLGLAAWAMGEVGFKPALAKLETLKEREDQARIYVSGNFTEKSVGQWAAEAVAKIKSTV